MKPREETNRQNPSAAKFSKESLRGILLPFTTPFASSGGEVDTRALRSNIEKWNETGVSGYVALGSTGERVHLEESECLEVIEAARAAVPEHLAFIVGAGQQSTRATINEVRRFAAAGADALLIITPNFYRKAMTHEALVSHYSAVADASPVPVVLYSVPDLTGIAIAPETVATLSRHENIIGIKDSSADLVSLVETLRLVPDDFMVLTGNAPLLYAALSAGAGGAILAAGCVAARLCTALFRAVEAGEHTGARDLQRRLAPLARAVTTRYGIGGLKAALDMLGYFGGGVRAPLRLPGEDERLDIARLLEEAALSVKERGAADDGFRLAGARTS